MAYDKNKIFDQAIKAIEENPNIYFIEDVITFVGCERTTFYKFFPVDSDEMNTIKDKLEQNKIHTKIEIRAKLFLGNKAAELLSLYRLICTPEERQNLNQSYIDQSIRLKGIKFGKDAEDEEMYV